MKEEKVPTTRLRFDFFKVSKGGRVARLVHSKVVEVFGVTKGECFERNEKGEEDLRGEIKLLVYPLLNLKKWEKKTEYHTLIAEDLPRLEDFFERERWELGEESVSEGEGEAAT